MIVPYYPTEKDEIQVKKPRWQKFLDVLNNDQGAEVIINRYRSYIQQKKFLEIRINLIIEGMR